jgi:hypothetical protein
MEFPLLENGNCETDDDDDAQDSRNNLLERLNLNCLYAKLT